MKNPNFKFEDRQEVFFDTGAMKGKGIIRGCASNGVAILGKTYIIQVLNSEPPIDVKTYPFSNVAIPELYLTSKDDEDAKQHAATTLWGGLPEMPVNDDVKDIIVDGVRRPAPSDEADMEGLLGPTYDGSLFKKKVKPPHGKDGHFFD